MNISKHKKTLALNSVSSPKHCQADKVKRAMLVVMIKMHYCSLDCALEDEATF
jgi:hypothetical protein